MNRMVVSEIRSLYRDENDLFRTVTKRVYESNGMREREQWNLRRIEFIYRGSGASTAFRQPCNSSRTAARVADPTGVGIPVGGLGVRAEAGAGRCV